MSDHEKSISKEDGKELAMSGLTNAVEALEHHEYKDGKDTENFLGFQIDSGIATMAQMAYQTLIGGVTSIVTPKVYGTIQQWGKGHLDSKTLNHLSGSAAFAANTMIYTLPSLTEAYGMWSAQREATQDKVRQLSNVLDKYNTRGKSRMAAYNGIGIQQNEMIAHDRWRNAKINHTKLRNLIIPAVMKAAPNIWIHERDTFEAARTGQRLKDVQEHSLFSKVAKEHGDTVAEEAARGGKKTIDADDITAEHVKDLQENARVKNAIKKTKDEIISKNSITDGLSLGGLGGKVGAIGVLTAFAKHWVKSGDRKLERMFTCDYSALDMVINLQKQLGTDPMPHSFELPHHAGSLSLEAYIAEIIKQHQRDMANMNPNYTQIREALKENVQDAATALAEAIRKGDMSALTLVEYIGGGKIIRNQGRVIASREEVVAMIEHDAGKHVEKADIDPKDFWNNASYNKEEAKEAFAALHGEERQIAISWTPHALRKEFGVSDKESKEVDAATAKEMETHIAEAILAISKMEPKTLKSLGLASTEITQLQEAGERVERDGVDAVHDLRSSAAHPNGIERVLLGVVVGSEIRGDKEHFGTVLKRGRDALKAVEKAKRESSNDNDDDTISDTPVKRGKAAQIAAQKARDSAMNDNDVANDNDDDSYAERETSRRNGTDGQETYRD